MSVGNFGLAPPAKTVDGLLAVPIDITSIRALLTFDGAAQTASAEATINYTVGPTDGHPIFDLRQIISQAWLDGTAFDVNKLRHHDFGGGQFADLRVIESQQAAGSAHTLRVKYDLAIPNLEDGGNVPLTTFQWGAGPKLTFAFAMSDLRAARYLEAWIPSNLIFDQFSINLELQITGTTQSHSVITNGTVTEVAANHWRINFPNRFSALSPLLEVRAGDAVIRQPDTVVLPVSGKTVNIETWKPASDTAVDLATEIGNIKNFLTENENDFGAYLHDERFVVSFNDGGGGMEYEGGTTTDTEALNHETFHSWFARGVKPASQADGWWDEGFTRFHDEGADDAVPLNFSSAPVPLCSRDPWQRKTPGSSYEEGKKLWMGIAALLGVSTLKGLMKQLYEGHKGNPVSTQMIEEFLLCKGGVPQVVDAFHRFVYGFDDGAPVPDLWLKDNATDTGTDASSGTFSNSPDLWIRNANDDGTTHQSPKAGQDNWLHARVRNRAGAGTAHHFVVTFRFGVGANFVYPADFLPCVAAKAGFNLAPNHEVVVKALWPRAEVPGAGSNRSMLVSVIAKEDQPVVSRRVAEDNNLAQKDITVVS